MKILMSLFLVKYIFLLLLNFCVISAFAAPHGQDLILQKTLTLKTDQIEHVLEKTEANIRVFAENFNIQLDSGAKITTPKKVIGSLLEPVLQISVKKCVLFICQSVDLDAEFILKKTSGACDFNYNLLVNLEKSSAILSDLYTEINTQICFKKTESGAQAELKMHLVHAETYQQNVVQGVLFSFVKIQSESILESFSQVMKINGAE